jgi:rhodanese-related sulfurtransferase
MIKYILLLFLALIFLPQLSYALPPPDLILSISQSFLNLLGALIATIVLVFGSIQIYFREWFYTKLGKIITFSMLIIIIGCLVVLLYLKKNQNDIIVWKTEIDAELREIWDIYEPIYSATEEYNAKSLVVSGTEVTWPEFIHEVDGEDYVIIDIRDRYPYEIGHISGSVHMRFADLLTGGWQEIEAYKNKPVFIVCYLGTTGSLASEFLSAKGFTKLYKPEGGITQAVERNEGIPFEGEAVLPRDSRMARFISQTEAREKTDEGALVIDLRAESNYQDDPGIPVKYRFFREKEPQESINGFLAQLASEPEYILICHGGASCYSAWMLLHDLDAAGKKGAAVYNTEFKDGKRNFILP